MMSDQIRPNQLIQLVRSFPPTLVSTLPGSGGRPSIDYVSHAVIRQRLLQVCGVYDWDVTLPFKSGAEKEPVAVVGTLTVIVDRRPTSVAGVGQGADAKTAESDAFKRAAMNVGLGLHLWAGKDFFLERQFTKDWPEEEE